MGQELEWKYRADPERIAGLSAAFGPFRQIAMETTYYDTPDRQLSSRRWTLRRRLENGVGVCTLKTPGPEGARWEWETEAPDIETGISALCRLSGSQELENLTAAGVMPICGARFTRQAALVAVPEGTVELALDQGVLLGRLRELALCEVEVELKSGSRQAAEAFARKLAEQYGLVPETASKFKRARDLAEQETEHGI